MVTSYYIVVSALLSLNIVLNIEYNRCIFVGFDYLYFNYKNFNKSLHYRTILRNQNESLEYNCAKKDSEISCKTLTSDTYSGILQGRIVTKYNITLFVENQTILSFPFTFDQCHIWACEKIISFARIQRIQKLGDHELSVIYGMTPFERLTPNMSVYSEITDLSNGSKQISHVDKSILSRRIGWNEKKIAIQNICSDYRVCLVTSWQACINDRKVNKTFSDCKEIYRKESNTNIDAQCRLYPKEKRVLAIFMSPDVTKEFELSFSGISSRYTTNKSSISIWLTNENIKNVSLTPCTKCSCSKKEKVRCIEDKVTRGKSSINIWHIVIVALIIAVVVVVLVALFCRKEELIKRIRQRRQGDAVEPREPVNEYTEILDEVNEYTEILDKRSYDKVVISEKVCGDDKLNEKEIVS